jgi:hypothetical protein
MFTLPGHKQHMPDLSSSMEKEDHVQVNSPWKYRYRRSLHLLENLVYLHLTRDLLPKFRHSPLSNNHKIKHRASNLE